MKLLKKLGAMFSVKAEVDRVIVLNLLQAHGIPGDNLVAGVQRLIQ